MFESSHLFKSINCPFYQVGNVVTKGNVKGGSPVLCDRPYCQFRHATVTTTLPVPSVSTTIEPVQPQVSIAAPSTQATQNVISAQLPTALENLANALQSVQELIRSNNTSVSSILGTSTDPGLAEKLNAITNVLLNKNSSAGSQSSEPNESRTITNNSSTVSPSSSQIKTELLKRQQSSAPDYNPTPIVELQKEAAKQQTKETKQSLSDKNNNDDSFAALFEDSNSSNNSSESSCSTCESSSSSDEATVVNARKKVRVEPGDVIVLDGDNNDHKAKVKNITCAVKRKSDDDKLSKNTNDVKPVSKKTASKKSDGDTAVPSAKRMKSADVSLSPVKSKLTSSKSVSMSATVTPSSAPERRPALLDMATFSKLTLKQQVARRYELMNKPVPSLSSALAAKVKKEEAAEKPPSKISPANTPTPSLTLLLDADENSTKVPLLVRQKFLSVIYENGRGLFATTAKAAEKAAEQEKSIYDRAKNKQIYTNLAANLVATLRVAMRNEQAAVEAAKTGKPSSGTMSLNKTSPTFSPTTTFNGSKSWMKLQAKDLDPSQLYKMLHTYMMNEKQLDENGFPKWVDATGTLQPHLAYIPNFSKLNASNGGTLTSSWTKSMGSWNSSDDGRLVKTCKRCNNRFQLMLADMSYSSSNSECVYHWGKTRNIRFNKSFEQKYSCCNGDLNSTGCSLGKHVYDGDYDGNGSGLSMSGYVETATGTCNTDTCNAYALDCEMCYTTKGLELARVSVVDTRARSVYESIVRPDGFVLDYNTRWSGLTERSFDACKKRLADVQADMLRLFNRETILIGHSLDSDFKALKLVHRKVIDTSVVFPHKLGPPLKRSLKNLMVEHLQKIIQEDAEGHDSIEDALACIELMMWKVSEDLKIRKKTIAILGDAAILPQPTVSPTTSDKQKITTTTPVKTTPLVRTPDIPMLGDRYNNRLIPIVPPPACNPYTNTIKKLDNSHKKIVNSKSTPNLSK